MRAINLLPQKSPEEEVLRRKKRVRYIAVFVLGMVFLLVWLLLFVFLQTLKSQERTLALEVNAKEQSVVSLSESELLFRLVFDKATAAGILLKSKKMFIEDIINLEKLLFPGIVVNDIEITKDRAKMTVNTFDIGLIIAFLDNLEKKEQTKFFEDLSISSISINPLLGYEVTIEGGIVHAQ